MTAELSIRRMSGPEGSATVREAWREGTRLLLRRGVESARLDAEVLSAFVLGNRREELYGNQDAPIPVRVIERFRDLIRRRCNREPLAYILGRKEFWSLDFLVDPRVLVPRPETERLIEVALDLMAANQTGGPLKVFDLGTGCGVLAICLAKERIDLEIWASDISAGALRVARENSRAHGLEGRIRFVQGELFGAFRSARGLFDFIVSNPPYVRRGDLSRLSPEVRDWEPREALDGGSDGLNFYRRISGEAAIYLKESGYLVLEIGSGMGNEVREIFSGAGAYGEGLLFRDYAGRERVIAFPKRNGCWPGNR